MLYYDEIGSRPLHSEQKMGKLCDKCKQFHSKKDSKNVSEFSL